VLVATYYPGGLLEKDLQEAGVPVRTLNKRGRWEMFGFLLRLVQIVRRERPDVLHGYLATSNILAVLLKPLFPRTHVVWGVRASNVDLERYDWFIRLSYKVERWLSRFADLIVVNSRAGRSYAIAKGLANNKMMLIPNGIDTKRFCPDPRTRRLSRAEWGVTEGEKLIGLIGRLDPMKDHPTFLRAAAVLSDERKDVRFVCVGDGPVSYQRELRELSEELGLAQRLIWAYSRVDMPAVYNALDVHTSSSYGEGFPNVVGEAMACGVPCVVTDVGDSAWIVGELGVVVPPTNPEQLAAGLARILDDLNENRDSIGYRLRQRIVYNFSLDRLVGRTAKTLESVVRET
jgi:glycosyltransferase involved in cell wall biosynthesis